MKIRVHSVVAGNSIPYYEYMIRNYKALARRPDQLEFFAHSLEKKAVKTLKNNPNLGVHQIVEVYKYPSKFVNQSFREKIRNKFLWLGLQPKLRGSNGHATGLQSILQMTGCIDIDIIADTDTVVLAQNWDDQIREVMKNYGIIGTCYEDIGGFSSGLGKVQTYKNKPTLTWCALSSKFNFSSLDTSPAKHENILIDTPELAELYNIPVGYSLVRDAAWKIPLFLQENKIPYAVFKHIKPTSKDSLILKTSMDYHEEYHLGSKPFIGHQRGSHYRPFRGDEISISFYNACDKHLSSMIGEK